MSRNNDRLALVRCTRPISGPLDDDCAIEAEITTLEADILRVSSADKADIRSRYDADLHKETGEWFFKMNNDDEYDCD